ncbi:SpaA isopeptide-forming pilin-related protein, partial [Enterococcus gallinarum]|uniref:SpaA isopeptide-forming pilin-related protein n=1 Tax=Enterococcus gallinarum TaxID=1353 RepID=UPI0020919C5B|nr:SpaA isopeptide-forming pilin-related protein [Enterococcus gallinarum]
MQIKTKKSWLKVAVFVAFSQFCFLTGTFQAQAEENTASQPTVETAAPAPVEAVEVQPVEESVPTVEVPAESVPETDAPTTNSKAVLDQTIGDAQNPGDSPSVTQPIETSEAEISPESSEESTSSTAASSETTDTSKATTTEDKSAPKLPTLTESSVEKKTDTSATNTEKSVEQPVENKETETESTEKAVVEPETKENTLSDKEVEDTFVVTQPRTTRARRAANDNIVHENLVGRGINWAIVNDPGRQNFTYNGIPMFTVNGQVAFCIQPGVAFKGNGQVHSTQVLDTYLKDASKRHKITLISYFGYVNSSDKSKEQYFATQLMIGEVLGRQVTWTYDALSYSTRKAAINKLVKDFNNKASFNNQTKTVKVGETIKVNDTTGFLSRVKEIIAPKGVNASVQGNQLVITVTNDAPEKVQIKLNQIKVAGLPIVYKKPGSQTIGVLNPIEPGRSVLNLNILKQGNLEILKIDAKTKKPLANAEIKVTINGKDQTVKTDKNGKATIKNVTHGTKGTVVEVKAPTGYILNKTSKDFTIEANKTIKVTLENKEQLG